MMNPQKSHCMKCIMHAPFFVSDLAHKALKMLALGYQLTFKILFNNLEEGDKKDVDGESVSCIMPIINKIN